MGSFASYSIVMVMLLGNRIFLELLSFADNIVWYINGMKSKLLFSKRYFFKLPSYNTIIVRVN